MINHRDRHNTHLGDIVYLLGGFLYLNCYLMSPKNCEFESQSGKKRGVLDTTLCDKVCR